MKTKTTPTAALPLNTPLQRGPARSLTRPKPRSTASPESPPSASLETLNPPNPTDTALAPTARPAPPAHAPYPAFDLAHRPSRRNGKIARLPKTVRDVVNRMLFLNAPQDSIVDVLKELGISATQQNISNWKMRGGYREWCFAQEHAVHLRLHQDNLINLLRRHDAPELPEVGLQAAATQLSQFFLTPHAQHLLASNPKEYERRVAMLARISAQLKPLQQSRDDAAKALGLNHDPDRIRNETSNSLERVTEAFTAETGESARDPDIPHRNLLPNPNELFNFTDRALDDHKDHFLEYLERWHARSCTPKPQSPEANESTNGET